MIQFESVEIEGFRTFHDPVKYVFPRRADGFYLVTGENREKPQLGANGVGKTSLFSTILWILYGKTERGTKAGVLASRGGPKYTSGTLRFRVDGASKGLSRTWNPNSLTLDEGEGSEPRVVSQEEVDRLIGLGYEGALLTFIFGQQNAYFFDLSPTEKLAVLSQYLELEVWTSAAERAGKKVAELDLAAAKTTGELNRAEGRVEALRSSIAATVLQSATFEEERRRRIKDLVSERRAREQEREKSKGELREATEALNQVESELEAAKARLLKLDDVRAEGVDQRAKAQAKLAAASALLAQEEARIQRLEALDGECPVCLQGVDDRHYASARKKLDGVRAKAQLAVEAAEAELAEAVRLVSARVADVDQAGKALAAIENRQRSAGLLRSRLAAAVAAFNSELQARADREAEAQSQKNPHEAARHRMEAELKEEEARLGGLQQEATTLGNRKALVEFWVSAFRDVRLWIVEQALSELELHVNNALGELGLDVSVGFSIERARQDGKGVIRGFNVLFYATDSEDPVPWESFSGGETQRLRLAGAIGLSDLVCARAGFRPSFEVWDEPTAHLSEEGTADLVALLGGRARLRGRQVFLIDHRTLNAGEFDGVVKIVRTAEGSSIDVRRTP